MRPDTSLVSIMAVNNEIGVKQPIKAIGRPYSCEVFIKLPDLLYYLTSQEMCCNSEFDGVLSEALKSEDLNDNIYLCNYI